MNVGHVSTNILSNLAIVSHALNPVAERVLISSHDIVDCDICVCEIYQLQSSKGTSQALAVVVNIVVSVKSISKSNDSFPAGLMIVFLSPSPAVSFEFRTAGVVSVTDTATFVSAPPPLANVLRLTAGLTPSINIRLVPLSVVYIAAQFAQKYKRSPSTIVPPPSLEIFDAIADCMSSQN